VRSLIVAIRPARPEKKHKPAAEKKGPAATVEEEGGEAAMDIEAEVSYSF
jgi:hypothetical protein